MKPLGWYNHTSLTSPGSGHSYIIIGSANLHLNQLEKLYVAGRYLNGALYFVFKELSRGVRMEVTHETHR